jgi:hypothetical protein
MGRRAVNGGLKALLRLRSRSFGLARFTSPNCTLDLIFNPHL